MTRTETLDQLEAAKGELLNLASALDGPIEPEEFKLAVLLLGA